MHLIVPAGAIHHQPAAAGQQGGQQRAWQWKGRGYLFPAANLAKVFRAKWLDGMRRAGLQVQPTIPRDWVVHCQSVGSGSKALVSLGRYLYRGVLPEKDILSDRDGLITFRIHDNSGAVLIHSLLATTACSMATARSCCRQWNCCCASCCRTPGKASPGRAGPNHRSAARTAAG